MQANVPAARATSLRTTTYLLASLLYSRTTYLLQADVGPRARAATQPRRLPLSVAWRLCRGVHWAVRPDAAGLVRPVHAWRAARAECLGALHDGALWGTSRGRLARWRAGARHGRARRDVAAAQQSHCQHVDRGVLAVRHSCRVRSPETQGFGSGLLYALGRSASAAQSLVAAHSQHVLAPKSPMPRLPPSRHTRQDVGQLRVRPAGALLPAAACARERLGLHARVAHRLAGLRSHVGRVPGGSGRVAGVDGRHVGRRLRSAVSPKTLAALVLVVVLEYFK